MLRLWTSTMGRSLVAPLTRPLATTSKLYSISEIPPYDEKFHEDLKDKRSRLLYQSRKRGMLENGLLLGSFANKYLDNFNEEQLTLYDRLINLPSNDWDIYYWAIGNRETPEDFKNEVMDMLQEHAKNKDRESRVRLPDLK